MEKKSEEVQNYFQNNPGNYGYILIVLGLVLIYGAYKEWGWIFEGGGRTINITWIYNTFGKKAAKSIVMFFGAVLAVLGIFWIYINRN
jgi:hypothetical protein